MFGWKKTPAGAETTQENVYLGGSVVATIDHDWPSNAVLATKYQHTDALGSPVATTDAGGALIERTHYEPYGSAINKTVDGIGYTGHVMDGATGLMYMQQRYYDPTLGRFLSVDPVTADSGTGGNFNRYKYASNNPYRFTDPDGRQDRAYGAGASILLTPEQRRVREAQERAATTEGSRALQGAVMMDGVKQFAAEPKVTKDSVLRLATVLVIARLTHGKNVTAGGGARVSNLAPHDLRRIQNAANRTGETITIVGSRATGKTTPNSDWDYVINAKSKTQNNLARSLPGAGNINEGKRSSVDIFRGEVDKSRPYIEVKPEP